MKRFADSLAWGAAAALALATHPLASPAESPTESPPRADGTRPPQGEIAWTELRELRGLPTNSVNYLFKSPFVKDVPVRMIVVTPTKMEPGKRYPVLYFLNEYAGNPASTSGVNMTDVADTHQVICVDPGYPSHPWYADHPTDRRMREESFLLKTIIPLVDEKYPTIAEGRGRFLVGYSKAGFGAFTLLLRHPDMFARAAAWDAPLSLDKPDRWNMADVYGTQENYDLYRPFTLLRDKADLFTKDPAVRFILLGHGLFGKETEQAHELMNRLGIPHHFDNSTRRDHTWGSGWLPDAVARLFTR